MSEATLKCLETAEKILKCLSDESIYMKYEEIKNKYLTLDTRAVRAQNHLKLVTLQNRELAQKRDELITLSKQEGNTLNEWSMNFIRKLEIQAYPLTEQNIRSPESFEEACEQLTDLLAAKQKASDEYRTQITIENARFRDKISSETARVTKAIDEFQQNVLSNDHQFRKKKAEYLAQIDKIQKKIDKIQETIEAKEDENERIHHFLSEQENEQESKALQYQSALAKKKKAKEQLKSLRSQVERYQSRCNAKKREIDEIRVSQRFGIATTNPESLTRLQEIELEVAELLKNKEKLTFEIKKKKYTNENELTKLTSTSIPTLESSIIY